MNKKILGIIFIINLLGALYGFIFYYGSQLIEAIPKFWLIPFIPDCPLAALLMGVSFLLLASNKNHSRLNFFSSALALKYGFWTLFVLTAFSSFYFSQNFLLYSVLFVSHIFLIAEIILLAGKIRAGVYAVGLTLAFFLLNDLVDYFWATHPPLPAESLSLMLYLTLVMSLVFTGLIYFFAVKTREK